jgi:glycosyltransferase involved in cell wall biosynthesis
MPKPNMPEASAPEPVGPTQAMDQREFSDGHGSSDQRLTRIEKESRALRRELNLLRDDLTDVEAQIAKHAPVLEGGAVVLAVLRAAAAMAMLPVRAAKTLATAPAAAKRIKEAGLRSERLVKDPVRGWISKRDMRAYLSNAGRAVGLSTRPIYRVTPQQRVSLRHRPRILHVIPNVWVGGSTQLILDLHDYLGHRFDMKIVTSALPLRERHQGMNIAVVPRPAPRFDIRRIFTSFNPHIVHIHYWGDVDDPWYRPFFEMAAELGCPILQNVNTPVTPFCDVPVAQNVFVSQTILDQFGSAVPARVIHPGIDLALFSPPIKSDPDSYDAIGMVYRLERDKLDEGSIEPLIAVTKLRPQTRAIIVGDGTLFAHFRARVAQEKLLDRFEFTGAVPYRELPSHYARFKVFVAPVWQESFGQVVPFAMSMGLAVAGNRIGALPEILGDAGTLGTTPEELVSHVLRLLESRAAIDETGARNRAIACSKFAVEGMAVAYLDTYKEMIPEAVELMPDYPPAIDFPL